MDVDVMVAVPATTGATGTVACDAALRLMVRASPARSGPHDRAAGQLACDTVHRVVEQGADVVRRFSRTPTPALRERVLALMEDAFHRAAQEVFAFARRHDGVEVSLDAVLLSHRDVFVSHVGAGRTYLARRGILHQLTVDHVDTGSSPPRLRRALGPRPSVRPESLCMEVADGDRFVCMTDAQSQSNAEEVLLRALISGPLRELARRIDLGVEPVVAMGVGDTDVNDLGAQRLAILAPMPLFTHCSERQLRQVARATHPRRMGTGAVLFHQGDRGEDLFLVISGRIRIERDGQHIVSIGPGSNFGEMAMLDQPIRSATAIASEPSELLVIKKEAFFSLLRGQSQLAVKILWNMALTLSANLRKSTERIAEITGDAHVPRPPTSDQPLEQDYYDPNDDPDAR